MSGLAGKAFTPLEAGCRAACRRGECQWALVKTGFNASYELLTGFTKIDFLVLCGGSSAPQQP